jgi:hypothetical protein
LDKVGIAKLWARIEGVKGAVIPKASARYASVGDGEVFAAGGGAEALAVCDELSNHSPKALLECQRRRQLSD